MSQSCLSFVAFDNEKRCIAVRQNAQGRSFRLLHNVYFSLPTATTALAKLSFQTFLLLDDRRKLENPGASQSRLLVNPGKWSMTDFSASRKRALSNQSLESRNFSTEVWRLVDSSGYLALDCGVLESLLPLAAADRVLSQKLIAKRFGKRNLMLSPKLHRAICGLSRSAPREGFIPTGGS